MEDPLKIHQEKMAENTELQQRMDDDRDLLRNIDYVMKDKNGKAVNGVVNMRGNRPLVFAGYVEAALTKADEKVQVNSDDEKVKTADIEDMLRAVFAQANQKRRKAGKWNVEPVIDQLNCRRGASALLTVCTLKTSPATGPYIDIDMVVWDTRFTAILQGEDGLSQAGIETMKKRDEIESSTWAVENGITVSKKTAKQTDIWTPEAHYYYLDEDKVFEEANPFGIVPVVYQKVPIGSMLQDEDNAQYEAESIFFMIRHLIPEFNRLVSILQTKNFEAVKPPIQVKTDKELDNDFYDKATAPGAATAVEDLNAIHPIRFDEIKQSALVLLSEINSMIDDGSLSRIMLGELPSGGLSAIALLQVEQGQGQVYMPRLGTRGLIKQQAAEMVIEQILMLNQTTFELGTRGHKRKYNKKVLDGEYEIEYVYTNKNPESDYARLSMGKAYQGILDRETILSDILKRDDPEGDLAKLRREELRQVVPPLVIYDGLMALSQLYDDGDESVAPEIEIAEAYLQVTREQLSTGQFPQISGPQSRGGGQAELPIMAGDRSSAQAAADLTKTTSDVVEAG